MKYLFSLRRLLLVLLLLVGANGYVAASPAKGPLTLSGINLEVWGSYKIKHMLFPNEEWEFFVEITRKDKGFDKESSWYRVCERQCIPFITIRARSGLATVQWDYMPYPPSIDEALFAQHKNIKTQISAIYDRYASKDTWLGAGPGVISFGNLEIANAREVASDLYDIIFEAARVALEAPQTKF